MSDKNLPQLVITDDDLKAEPYRFALRGKIHELPSLDQLSTDVAFKVGETVEEKGPTAALLLLLDQAKAETRKAVLSLPLKQTRRIFDGWAGVSGVTPGESGSSADSSVSTDEQ